ncbi:hypothetical protein ACFL0C_02205 [Patescibacteria group bacterium]
MGCSSSFCTVFFGFSFVTGFLAAVVGFALVGLGFSEVAFEVLFVEGLLSLEGLLVDTLGFFVSLD